MKYYANLHGNIIQWLYHDCKVLGLGVWVVKTSAYHHSNQKDTSSKSESCQATVAGGLGVAGTIVAPWY
jgi:hypothetical protein